MTEALGGHAFGPVNAYAVVVEHRSRGGGVREVKVFHEETEGVDFYAGFVGGHYLRFARAVTGSFFAFHGPGYRDTRAEADMPAD